MANDVGCTATGNAAMSTVGPEARITAKLRSWLEQHGAAVVKIHGGRFGHAGMPDLLVCMQGRFIAFEVKQPGKKPTLIQAATLAAIQRAGGHAAVVTSLDEMCALLHTWELIP
jgi:Holliday junction resolvase